MFYKENKSNLLFKNLDELIENGILENKKIVLFGLNISSYATKTYLEEKGYSIFSYIDNSENKIMDTQQMLLQILPRHIKTIDYTRIANTMISVDTPEKILLPFQNDYVILISSKYYPAMCQQLNKMGYHETVHIFKTIDFHEIDSLLVEEKDIKGLTPMSMEEIHKKQLELAAYTVDLCKKNNLNIYMAGGTLLGAVRHQGFIPWDDDIDLVLPMPDYKKLINLIQEDNKYHMYNIYVNPTCTSFFTRIADRNSITKRWSYPNLETSGVDIDILPLSGLPEQIGESRNFFNRIRRIYSLYTSMFFNATEHTDAIKAYTDELRNKILEMTQHYNFYESKSAGYLFSKYLEKEIAPREVFDGTIYMKFENLELPAPSGYDTYLQCLYGDYMTPPKEEDRYSLHNFRAYHLNK